MYFPFLLTTNVIYGIRLLNGEVYTIHNRRLLTVLSRETYMSHYWWKQSARLGNLVWANLLFSSQDYVVEDIVFDKCICVQHSIVIG